MYIGSLVGPLLHPCTPVHMQKAAVACRLMGKVALRHRVLGKHGPLVVIPEDKCQESTEATFAYIKRQYEAVIGMPLGPA